MGALATAGIVFLCLIAGAGAAALLRPRLPAHHLSAESKDLLKQGLAIVGTMTALIIGLLVASAKSSFDEQAGEVTKVAANLVVLDRLLASYGPETADIRRGLRTQAGSMVEAAWGDPRAPRNQRWGDPIVHAVMHLQPQDDGQRWAREWSLRLLVQLATSRWTIAASLASPVPRPLLIVIVFWLTLIFFGMGLLAPPNLTNSAVMIASAAAAAGAVLLILELYNPFHGLLRISPAPFELALSRLAQ